MSSAMCILINPPAISKEAGSWRLFREPKLNGVHRQKEPRPISRLSGIV